MKKQLIFLIIVIGVVLMSCTSNNETPLPSTINYETIGKFHNEGLDDFIVNLANEAATTKGGVNSISKERVIELKSETIKNTMVKFFGTSLDIEIVNDYIKSTTLNNTLTRANEIDELLSDNQISFTKESEKILDETKDPFIVRELISKLTQKYYSICSEEEFAYINIQATVLNNSFEYWSENMDKWEQILALSNSTKGSDTGEIKDIVIADALGAAIGAYEGAKAGAIGGTIVVPGVGTAGGAIVGAIGGGLSGAISGSIMAGVENWISSWFD